jgi:photosystem II stability/assembly factor-like uncharacterized protein
MKIIRISVIILLFALTQAGLSSTLLAQPWLYQSDTTELNYYRILDQWQAEYEKLAEVRGSGYKQFKRWEQYWKYRVNTRGEFPDPDILPRELSDFKMRTPVSKISTGSQWRSLGPEYSQGGYSGIGRINRIVVHPNDPNTLYITAAGGGLWVTKNRGTSWTPLTDHLPITHATGLVIDRDNPNTLILATGDISMRSAGIFKSTDAGATWFPSGLNAVSALQVKNLRQHPTNANYLYLTSNKGLYFSPDKGNTWSIINTNTGYVGDTFDIEFKPGSPNTIFISKLSYNFDTRKWESKIISSDDAGQTWTIRLTVPDAGRAELAFSSQDPNYLYAVVVNMSTNGLMGFYSSTDGGQTFDFKINTPNILNGSADASGTSGQGWYDLTMMVSPSNRNDVTVGGINLWRTYDAGNSWFLSSFWHSGGPQGIPVVHADQHELISTGSNIQYLANDGGIYVSQNNGTTWTDISNGLVISQAYRVGVSQLDSKIIMGLQDNGTKIYGLDEKWFDRIGGDGMDCEIDPRDPSVIYGTWQNGNLQRSTNGGLNFQNITPVGASRGNWISPIELSPTVPQKLYFGTDQVYMSTTMGTTWTNITASLTNTKIDQMAASPTTDGSLFITWRAEANLYKISHTKNDGIDWLELNLPVSNRAITDLVIDPINAHTLYITLGGYEHKQQVYKGVYNGDTSIEWTNISYNLPSINTNTIEVDYKPGTLRIFVGMDAGIYVLDELTNTWIPYNNDLPNVEVRDLEIRASDRMLVAGSFGRGLWISPMPETGTSTSDETTAEKPIEYALFENYPNPFNPSTNISFSIPKTTYVRLEVFSVLGQSVSVLVDQTMSSGVHNVQFNARNFSSGVYFYRLSTPEFKQTRVMTLIK